MDREFLRQIDSLDDLLADEKLEDEVLICECFCVSVKDIRETCAGKVDLELLQDQFSMGLGCQSCLKRKDSWIHKIF